MFRMTCCSALLFALVACDENRAASIAVPDIALMDVNPNSATYGEYVGPQDHTGHVSAWYFGKST